MDRNQYAVKCLFIYYKSQYYIISTRPDPANFQLSMPAITSLSNQRNGPFLLDSDTKFFVENKRTAGLQQSPTERHELFKLLSQFQL